MTASSPEPAAAMNRMYRYTRHVYDVSRRYYLLGRDRLLRRIAAREQGAVLEVGCGTARNLVRLHDRAPHLDLYGLDAADVMLDTARRAVHRAGASERIHLAQGLAQTFDAAAAFGRAAPFEAVFFSYALSMIPPWAGALDAALRHLAPGGRLYVVDFWDQQALPRWVGSVLRRWLGLFGVHFRPEVHRYLQRRVQAVGGGLTIEPVARRYAYIATLDLPTAPARRNAPARPINDSITQA